MESYRYLSFVISLFHLAYALKVLLHPHNITSISAIHTVAYIKISFLFKSE